MSSFAGSAASYACFAPLYWHWMLRRAAGKPICEERRRPLVFADDPPPGA